MIVDIQAHHIAHCGVNCAACSAFLSVKNPCPGCRAPHDTLTRKSCRTCAKRQCNGDKGLNWCFECSNFPCARIKNLNTRYLKNYDVDLIANGRAAHEDMESFLIEQRKRFTCTQCGGMIDQHHRNCSECGHVADL